MRYRAHNVIEALAHRQIEAEFVADEDAVTSLDHVLSHDLIVLVRRQHNERMAAVIDAAREAGVPVVYDIDDYVFDAWALPYIEGYHHGPAAEALALMGRLRGCLERCDYFTGTTPYLVEKVSALGKRCFRIRNGLNAAQIELSEQARQRGPESRRDGGLRLGYFSGTRTHQADFRVAYPALLRLMSDFTDLRLVVVGVLDLDHFAGLSPFAARIEQRPAVRWQDLPAEVARVDVNLIPLDINPFTEGKSDLKYFEAGLLGIPSVASPTRVLSESIAHGDSGFLARTGDDWYDCLRQLIVDAGMRERMGDHARAHVLRTYHPRATAQEAVLAYREILRAHRAHRGVHPNALSIVILVEEPDATSPAHAAFLALAEELARRGEAVTVLFPASPRFRGAAELELFIGDHFVEPLFSVQLGGEVPCCDALLATDVRSARLAQEHRHRGRCLFHLRFDDEPEWVHQAPESSPGPSLRILRLAAPGTSSSTDPTAMGSGAPVARELLRQILADLDESGLSDASPPAEAA
jgi:glycosyltransferase involved in cell wall biosynthesis